MIDLYTVDSVGIDMTEVKSQNDIEMNDDGKTAYCDTCHKNQPATEGNFAEWNSITTYHGTYYQPPEYGQQCPDCSSAEARADDLAFERYQEEQRGI